jgi:pyrroloquinoline-quinone synthase
MNFTQDLMAKLSDKHLLKHEFYQKWSDGSIPLESLRLYARQYYHHVKAFPRYLSAIHSNCDRIQDRQILLENLNDEEAGPDNHPELWLRFAEGLGEARSQVENAEWMPETQELVETFLQCSRQSYAEGLGVLFAYEHQIPEIAKFKMEALRKHYSLTDSRALAFFEVHQKADVYHTQAISRLLEDLPVRDQEKSEQTARMASHQLWKFLDGVYGNIV